MNMASERKFIIKGSLTEVVAGTFVTGAFLTGLTGTENFGWQMDSVEVEFPSFPEPLVDCSIAFGFTRAEQASSPVLLNDDLLFAHKIAINITTSGVLEYEPRKVLLVPQSPIIIETETWAYARFIGFTGLQTVSFKLNVSERKVTTDERLAILQSRVG